MEQTGLRILEMVGAGLFGGGLTFIGTLLKRKWEKEDKQDAVSLALTTLSTEIGNTNKNIESVRSSIMGELAKDRAENEEYRIKQCRARILQFSDEIYRGIKHTKESFDDVIEEGIDKYEDYCNTHEDFKNFKAVAAIQNIKDTYMKCLKESNFLS